MGLYVYVCCVCVFWVSVGFVIVCLGEGVTVCVGKCVCVSVCVWMSVCVCVRLEIPLVGLIDRLDLCSGPFYSLTDDPPPPS